MSNSKKDIKFALNKNYPALINSRHGLRSAAISSLITMLCVIALKPGFIQIFELTQILEICFLITILSFVTILLFYKVYTLDGFAEKWTFKKDLIWVNALLMFMAIEFSSLGYIFIRVRYNDRIGIPDYFVLQCFVFTFLIGYFCYVVIKSIDLFSYYIDEEQTLYDREIKSQTTNIIIKGKNKNEIISIKKEQFVFMNAIGHYVNLTYLDEEGNLIRRTVRNSIKELKLQLEQYGFLDCHRSYMVNQDFIESLVGDSQKTRILLKGSDEEIPVSRRLIKETRLHLHSAS